MRREKTVRRFFLVLSAILLLTCSQDDGGVTGPTAPTPGTSANRSGSPLSLETDGGGGTAAVGDAFSCRDLQEWFVRFSRPGYVRDNVVGLYYNYVGCPVGYARLEIFWDMENSPSIATNVRLGPGEVHRNDDSRCDHSGTVVHEYPGLVGPTPKVVRVHLILNGCTGNCATVRRVTVSPPPAPAPPPPRDDGTIQIEKFTNGADADEPTGPKLNPGEPVIWTYKVTNSGTVVLTDVTVTDDQGVAVSCPMTRLAPGERMGCEAAGTAMAGQYQNIGTVTARRPDGVVVTDSDRSYYLGIVPSASVDIEKATNGHDADTAPRTDSS